jgi:HEAT repeat protein
LELFALDASPARVLVQGAFRAPRLTTSLPGKAAEFKAIEPGLSKPFLFELLPGNVLGEIWVQPNLSVLVAGIQKTVVAYLQGGDRGESVFLADEQDTTGTYQALYSRADASGSFDKQKLRYLSAVGGLVQPSAASAVPKVDVSKIKLQFEPTGRLLSVSGSEQVTAGGMVGSVESKSAIELTRSSSAVLTDVPDYHPLLAALQNFSKVIIAKQDSSETDALRLAGRTLDQVLVALRAQGPEPKDETEKEAYSRRQADLFGALQALVRTKKGTIARLTTLIASGDPMSPVLIDALSGSGSADAQHSIVRLLDKGKLTAVQQRMVAISLSRSQHPTQETTSTLVRLLEDPNLRTQATYGLGTCIRRLRADGEVAHARRLLDVVLSRLRSASSTLERVTALRALANSGDEEAYPTVEPLLASTDEQVRAAAVESLQLVNLVPAEQALARALSSDPSKEVRLAATRALLARKTAPAPALLDAASSAALKDDNPHVRMAAVRVLGTWLPTNRQLNLVLAKVADSDGEKEIRQLAESALKSQPPSPAAVR